MKRTKDIKGQSKYRKDGGGSLRLPGRMIKPNQEFWAFPHELPGSAMDVITLIEGDPPGPLPVEVPVEVKKLTYELVSRGGGGWYNIVDSNGKVVNEKALKEDKAKELLDELEA